MKSPVAKKHNLIHLLLTALLAAIFSQHIRAEPPLWAETLTDELDQVDAGGNNISLLTRQQGYARGLGHVLIVHGVGQHPDWHALIRPMRQKLPDYGWTSVSVEMPEMVKEDGNIDHPALLAASTAHFEAALTHMKSIGAERIVVIGYGMGARLAVNWINKTTPPAVKAIVLISMEDGSEKSGLDSNMDTVSLNLPMLDILAENDKVQALEAGAERLRYRLRLPQYRQLVIYAADQYYSQMEDELIKRIRGWLKLTFEKK